MPKKHKKDPASWQIKRRRDGRTHIDACRDGYLPGSSKFKQVHHIVCVSSMADGTISDQVGKDKLKFVQQCLKITKWDINGKDNNVGLPLKRAFADRRAPTNWDGWPCHQVDHPPYTDRVSERLNVNVWQQCFKGAKKCEVDEKSLTSQLNEESVFWLEHLVMRGAGSAAAWTTRDKNPDTWYIPFSMHPDDPPPRKAPPKWEDFDGTMKQFLKGAFELIGG